MGETRQLECPRCKAAVEYDPDDPMHRTTGAMRANPGKKATVVYLTCPNGHASRFELS